MSNKAPKKEFQDPLDIFDTAEFKALPWQKRLWIRLKVAFFETISMY